jgi:hypothetical protein
MRKEREGAENETEKILSAEIVWTAVPPAGRSPRTERRYASKKKRERKEILIDLREVVPSSTIQRAILNKCALLLVLMATSEVPVHEECIMWL